MSYTLTFKNAAVDTAKTPITVAVGTVNTTATDLTLTGKGAANFGAAQQINLLRLLENFADTVEPANPTVGQLWYDASERTLKVLTDTLPRTWQELNGIQVTDVGESAPTTPQLGDLWLQRTGAGSGFLYTYTGLGRHPTTATTIGGWDQIWPSVELYAGRDEYDAVRELLDRLIGPAVSTYGSGALGRSITTLTNFGELDRDLRAKYKALGGDATLLISPNGTDAGITRQAPSSNLFYYADTSGTALDSSDGYISGAVNGIPTIGTPGTIYVDGTLTTLPAGTVGHNSQLDDAYLLWDSAHQLSPSHYIVVKLENGQWFYDDAVGNAWIAFTPSSGQYIIGTITSNLDNNNILPGDMWAHLWAHAMPIVATSRPKYEHLKVEPTSQDWDELLAATKYALNRLELPPDFVRTVSQLPFTYDGRQISATLQALSPADVRYPGPARRAGRKGSVIGLTQSFAETFNALSVALSNRFSLKGVNGSTGTNTTLLSTASFDAQATFSGIPTLDQAAGTSAVGSWRISFTSVDELQRWLGSGAGIRFTFSHAGGSNAGDNNLRTLFGAGSSYLVTADRIRVFDDAVSPTMTRSTTVGGLWNASSSGTTLLTYTNAATISITATQSRSAGDYSFVISFTLTPGSALGGTLSVQVDLLQDHEASDSVYPILALGSVTQTNAF